MNIHREAIKFRKELQGVFSSFDSMEPWNVIGKFTEYLNANSHEIDNTTIYKYINETIFPAWLIPHLFDFLSQEPYSTSPYVWSFLQKYGRPVIRSLEVVKEQAKKRRQALIDEAGRLDRFL